MTISTTNNNKTRTTKEAKVRMNQPETQVNVVNKGTGAGGKELFFVRL